ncbi:TPA_asm: hypothetical protein [Porphyromonas phage phage020a_SJD2]|uniref:Secreted protein n=1 Tax=Porphyromonas phage phage020a_SJD2 TaxID=3154110 RepID=A0AAT9J8L2_9CAUD
MNSRLKWARRSFALTSIGCTPPSFDILPTCPSTSRASARQRQKDDLYPSCGYTSWRAMADISTTR